MKKLLFILFAFALGAASCSKEGATTDPDKSKQVNIRPYLSTLKAGYTTSEVVKTANIIEWEFVEYNTTLTPRSMVMEEDRDTILNIIKLKHEYIFLDGQIYNLYVEAKNLVFARWRLDSQNHRIGKDTIAYIPNYLLRRAEQLIKDNYNKGDFNACYAAMDTCYKFVPITGAEYKELRRLGKN